MMFHTEILYLDIHNNDNEFIENSILLILLDLQLMNQVI